MEFPAAWRLRAILAASHSSGELGTNRTNVLRAVKHLQARREIRAGLDSAGPDQPDWLAGRPTVCHRLMVHIETDGWAGQDFALSIII